VSDSDTFVAVNDKIANGDYTTKLSLPSRPVSESGKRCSYTIEYRSA
jgi:hypothetical protein